MFFQRKADVLFVLQLILTLLCHQGGVHLASAFVQNPTTTSERTIGGSIVAGQCRFQSKLGASVEEDLDHALSSFLDDDDEPKAVVNAKKLADVIPSKKQGPRMEALKLSDLLEESEVCQRS